MRDRGSFDDGLDNHIVPLHRAGLQTAMDYPEGFPEHLQPPVDAAIHQAEINLAKLRNSEQFKASWAENWHGALWICVRDVFFAFGFQVCKAGEACLWNGQRMRKELDRYLRLLIRHYYADLAPSPQLGRFEEREIIQSMKETPEWKELQQRLKEVAESKPDFTPNKNLAETIPSGEVTANMSKAVGITQVEKKTRRHRDPNHELLKNQSTSLTRHQAAEALGVSLRTFDRLTAQKKIIPVGPTSRKRYLVKDLQHLSARKH